jgi:glycine oxidase
VSDESRPTDVIVIGGGLIGLSVAVMAAELKMNVRVLHRARPGTATAAGAGMLAPGVERSTGAAHDFAIAARDRYPAFLDLIASRTGRSIALNRRGILELALDDLQAERLSAARAVDTDWLDAAAVAALDNGYAGAAGAVLHRLDGAVDSFALWDALWDVVGMTSYIANDDDEVVGIAADGHGVVVSGRSGARYIAAQVVVAGGAWTPEISGLPRSLPITPMRGQMLAYDAAPVRYVAYGPGGYIVPRPGNVTWVGATAESVGFANDTTPQGRAQLSGVAKTLVPALRARDPIEQWAGLRPMTPDFLPILGHDPDEPRVLYACGHSRNGILLAALTGEVIASLLVGKTTEYDLSPFKADRFTNQQK